VATSLGEWLAQSRKELEVTDSRNNEWVQRRATKITREIEHFQYNGRLRELGVFSLQRRRLQRDLTVAFQYLKGARKNYGDRLLR